MEKLLGKENRQYLMGFAILWIIGLHFYMYSAFPASSIWGFLFAKGYLGVDIFLFLSAYGLCYSFTNNPLGVFYKKRINRLYPVYLVFIVLMLVFFGSAYQEQDWLLFVLQCTGLASFTHIYFEWYVPALIVIYATFPLLFKGVSYLYGKNKFFVLLLVLALSFSVPFLSKILFPMFASRLPIVVLGILTYLCIRDDDRRFMYSSFALCAVYAIFLTRDDMLSLTLLIPGMLALVALSGIVFPLKKVVCFCGRHSLEIYLAQSFALNQFLWRSQMPYMQKTAIAFVLLIALSFMFYYIQSGFNLLINRAHS